MCSPASFQTAISTHWPSWSHAPSWCGWPKSPSVIGPSTADTISDRRISSGDPGEHVAAADPALGAHQPGALQGQQDLLEVRLGQAGALGDVAHRRRSVAVGVERERQQRPTGVVTAGRDAHADHGTAAPPPNAASGSALPAATKVVDSAAVTPDHGPLIPDYVGACVRGIIPALLGPGAWSNGAAGVDPRARGRRRAGRAADPRRPRVGAARRPARPDADAGLARRRADHDRRADDDGDGAELDRHRADPGRARSARVPDAARRRGAQRPALDQRPPATAGALTRPATSSRSPPSWATTCR